MPNKKPDEAAHNAGTSACMCEFTSCVNVPAFMSFLLGSLFDSEDGGDVFF
jgi:hypothetical protein